MAISSNTTRYGGVVPGPMQRPVTLQDPKIMGLNYPIPVVDFIQSRLRTGTY